MTFAEAMILCREGGQDVWEETMNARWCIRCIDGHMYHINPVLGSNYAYQPSEYDKTSNRWRLHDGQRTTGQKNAQTNATPGKSAGGKAGVRRSDAADKIAMKD